MPSQGLVHIATNTFSSVASTSFDNVFSATYRNYYAVAKVTASGTYRVRGRLRASGVDDSGSNYGIQYLYATGSIIGGIRGTGDSLFNGTVSATTSSFPNIGEMWLHKPFEATRTTVWSDVPDPSPQITQWTFVHQLSTSYDGISFLITDASQTMTGSISIFGMAIS